MKEEVPPLLTTANEANAAASEGVDAHDVLANSQIAAADEVSAWGFMHSVSEIGKSTISDRLYSLIVSCAKMSVRAGRLTGAVVMISLRGLFVDVEADRPPNLRRL